MPGGDLSSMLAECGCIAEVDTDDIERFEPVPAAKCDKECMSDASQLCGGRDVSAGERYASVYKSEDRTRSLHFAGKGREIGRAHV